MKLTVDEKLRRVKLFLKENKIRYVQNKVWRNVRIDVLIPSLNIVIQRGSDDGVFYPTVKYRYRPIFLRDEETMAFIMEKVQNRVLQQMMYFQKMAMKGK